MLLVGNLLMILAVFSRVECQRNTPRTARASRNEASLEFECPEEFGYYSHPRDCTQYYVCVFGGALLESCTGGLMYSHELQTCDWPRNVGCIDNGSSVKDTGDDDPLLERSAKAESQQRGSQRGPSQRSQVTSSSPSSSISSQITDRQSRNRQQPQLQRTTYQDDEYEPASEIESDRQQRVHRGQQSIIGQVQRDRDGLRRNIISVSSTHSSQPLHYDYITSPSSDVSYGNNIVEDNDKRASSTTTSTTTIMTTTTNTIPPPSSSSSSSSSTSTPPSPSTTTSSSSNSVKYNQQQSYLFDDTDYEFHDATKRNFIIVSSPSPFKLPQKYNYDTTIVPELTTIIPDIKQNNEIKIDRFYDINNDDDDDKPMTTTTTSATTTIADDLEQQNEILITSKKNTNNNIDGEHNDNGINLLKNQSKNRHRIKTRIGQRGRERYHHTDNSYENKEWSSVTMKTIIRKRPINNYDQIGKDTFGTSISIPLRMSTPQINQQKKYYINSRKLIQDSFDLNDIPTTLSPYKRALIVAQLQDQNEVEKNEILATPFMKNHRFVTTQSSIDKFIEITTLPSFKKNYIKSDKTIETTVPTTTTTTTTTTTIKPEISSQHQQQLNEQVDINEITASRRLDSEPTTTTTKTTSINSSTTRNQFNFLGVQFPRQRHRETTRRISTLEREKDSVANTRAQVDNHYRSISSENPRIVKTTIPTPTTPLISKAYFDPESYPYYTLYDDDVSIYKDDDYREYSVNQSVSLPPPPPPQQNVRIAQVTPNSNAYSQPQQKNQQVTESYYDIYENQGQLNKNKFHINDGQQSFRTNGLHNHQIVLTTPNAITDTYEPLTQTIPPTTTPTPTTTTTTTTTTTERPYTVTQQSRSKPQVNRGTAPPRQRPTLKPSMEIVSKAQEFADIYRHPAVRPAPIYPTPTVDKPAAKCRKDVCLLPDCSCGGSDIPGDFGPEETPQIVLLTFDDSVNDLNKGLYADLFEKGRKNPNGCPISSTFYVSHEWTDYSQVQNLYASGHEIASHTVSHSFGEQFSARKWAREVSGQREILAAYGGVKLEDVRGMRAPFLSVGGNNMFKMLWDANFTYDSSMPIYENRPPSWPYTLDYKLFHDCMIPPCPTRSYPGLWEVPMVMWQDLNGGRCSMGDACSNPPTSDGVYKMLIKNFERHYTTSRAPFGLFYHAAWFTQPHHKEGFISFLDTIVAMDDVWVVTNWQALQWIRNPTPLQHLNSFEPFGCNYPDRPKRCNNGKVCNLWHKSGVRYMKTCQPCPEIYPWTGKTGIPSSRIDNEIEN